METTSENVPEAFFEEKRVEPFVDADPRTESPRIESPGVGNIEKIREILFGGHAREYEKRFSRLEDRLVKEVSGLREDLRKRLDSLENHFKQEIDALNERLSSEEEDRLNGDRDLTKKIDELSESFNKKTRQMEDQAGKNMRELRQLILDQSKQLTDDILKKYEELTGALEVESGRIRHEKVDRAALSDLFTELSMRLTSDLASQLGMNSTDLNNE